MSSTNKSLIFDPDNQVECQVSGEWWYVEDRTSSRGSVPTILIIVIMLLMMILIIVIMLMMIILIIVVMLMIMILIIVIMLMMR